MWPCYGMLSGCWCNNSPVSAGPCDAPWSMQYVRPNTINASYEGMLYIPLIYTCPPMPAHTEAHNMTLWSRSQMHSLMPNMLHVRFGTRMVPTECMQYACRSCLIHTDAQTNTCGDGSARTHSHVCQRLHSRSLWHGFCGPDCVREVLRMIP